jgi:hypothetical protein
LLLAERIKSAWPSGPAKWPAVAALISATVLLVDLAYLYGVRFAGFVHSDSAGLVLYASALVRSGLPITPAWYYPNGDVWLLGPQLFVLPFLGIWGVSVRTLFAATLLGFAAQIVMLVVAYRKLGGRGWAAVLATSLTLVAWSRLHITFVYVELAYGFNAALYACLFALQAHLFAHAEEHARAGEQTAAAAPARRALRLAWVASAGLVFVLGAQNPVRVLAFVVVPVLLACAWPFRGVSLRARAIAASAPAIGLVAAKATYSLVLRPYVTFSNPSGHIAFAFRDVAGIAANARTIAAGVLLQAGDVSAIGLGAIVSLAAFLASIVIVARHAIGRAPSPLRFACVAVVAQLVAVGFPMLVGNLVLNTHSTRYLMPTLLVMLGLAAVIAVKTVVELEPRASRTETRLAWAFVALAPLSACVSMTRLIRSYSLESESGQFAHTDAHRELADELVRRGLREGFATYWNAHLVTILSHGATKVCPVNFGGSVIPYRWNTDTWCFDATHLPDRFFVVNAASERASATPAIEASLDGASERFRVGEGKDAFDVAVFDTAKTPKGWLTPPIPDGDDLRLPLHVGALHPQVRRGLAREEGGHLVPTGEEGNVTFGPFLHLGPGTYHLRWIGHAVSDTGALGFDVAIDGGKEVLGERTVEVSAMPRPNDGDLAVLELHLARKASDVELRVFSKRGGRAALEGFELTR